MPLELGALPCKYLPGWKAWRKACCSNMRDVAAALGGAEGAEGAVGKLGVLWAAISCR